MSPSQLVASLSREVGVESRKKEHLPPSHFVSRVRVLVRLFLRVTGKVIWFRLRRLSAFEVTSEIATILRQELGGLKGPLQKLGQMLSYLVAHLPIAIRKELRDLLVSSQPVSFDVVKSILDEELKGGMQAHFSEFSEVPIATGSIAQVHQARLRTGELVAVKVLIPKMEQIIAADLKLLSFCVPLMGVLLRMSNLYENFLEFKKLVEAEADLKAESDNILYFEKICADDMDVVIPRVFSDICTHKVLTMEFIDGLRFHEFVQVATQAEKNRAAEIIWHFGSRSINRFSIFHADPHPGNCLFLKDGRVAFLDFGFCKRWDPAFMNLWKQQTQAGVANNLPEFEKISRAMGIMSPKDDFDYAKLMRIYQKYSYRLWSSNQTIHFNHTFIKEQLKEILDAQIRDAALPVDLLAMSRWLWGVQHILAELDATVNITPLTWPYLIEETHAPTKPSSIKSLQARVAKLVLGYLPEDLRLEAIREKVRIPRFAQDSRLQVKVAETIKEIEQALRLLHDAYVDQGYMIPDRDQLRTSVHSFLPETSIVVVKFNGMVVGTLSLILDSKWGLPSDAEYPTEMNRLRGPMSRLVEVSAFAVDPDFRFQGNAMSLLLMKYLFYYCRDYLKGSHLVCAVRKEVEPFYKALFLFERDGDVINYRAVNGTEGIFLYMPLTSEHEEKCKQAFRDVRNSAFTDYFLMQDLRLKLPQKGAPLRCVFTPEVLHHFLTKRTRLLRRLPHQQVIDLVHAYQIQYGESGFFNEILKMVNSPGFRKSA